MNTADIIIIALILIAAVWAIHKMIDHRKNGSSCCPGGADCTCCSSKCDSKKSST